MAAALPNSNTATQSIRRKCHPRRLMRPAPKSTSKPSASGAARRGSEGSPLCFPFVAVTGAVFTTSVIFAVPEPAASEDGVMEYVARGGRPVTEKLIADGNLVAGAMGLIVSWNVPACPGTTVNEVTLPLAKDKLKSSIPWDSGALVAPMKFVSPE